MANTTPTAPRPAAPKDAPSPAAAPAATKPIAVFRFEDVSAAIFPEQVKTDQGPVTLLNTSLRRSYKDADGVWQHTHSLRACDVLPGALALLKCYEFVQDARSKDGGNGK